jgi:hypothetical protein
VGFWCVAVFCFSDFDGFVVSVVLNPFLLCDFILSGPVFYSSSISINFCHTDAFDLSSIVH